MQTVVRLPALHQSMTACMHAYMHQLTIVWFNYFRFTSKVASFLLHVLSCLKSTKGFTTGSRASAVRKVTASNHS